MSQKQRIYQISITFFCTTPKSKQFKRVQNPARKTTKRYFWTAEGCLLLSNIYHAKSQLCPANNANMLTLTGSRPWVVKWHKCHFTNLNTNITHCEIWFHHGNIQAWSPSGCSCRLVNNYRLSEELMYSIFRYRQSKKSKMKFGMDIKRI
jgi:hypothetical protein